MSSQNSWSYSLFCSLIRVPIFQIGRRNRVHQLSSRRSARRPPHRSPAGAPGGCADLGVFADLGVYFLWNIGAKEDREEGNRGFFS